MVSKLYVGNMPYSTTEDQLREMFSEAGTVEQVDVIKDRETGRAKGFAFITMASPEDAKEAIEMFNGKEYNGRPLTVNEARPREERSGGGGGGYRPRSGSGAPGGGYNRGGGGGNRGNNRGGGNTGGNRRY